MTKTQIFYAVLNLAICVAFIGFSTNNEVKDEVKGVKARYNLSGYGWVAVAFMVLSLMSAKIL